MNINAWHKCILLQITAVLVWLGSIPTAKAQTTNSVWEIKYNTSAAELLDKENIQCFKSFGDVQFHLHQIQLTFYSNGYLFPNVRIDSARDADTNIVFVDPGKLYKWDRLTLIYDSLERNSSLKSFHKTIVSKQGLEAMMNNEVLALANAGYPFASAQIVDPLFDETTLTAQLQIEKGPKIVFDTFRMSGQSVVTQTFLSRYLSILPGQPFNHSLVKQMDRKLNALSYLKLSGPSSLHFEDHLAVLTVDLAQRKVNQFDLIFGVVPANASTGSAFAITGEGILNLANPFGTGKQLQVEWKALRPQSPEWIGNFEMPYIFGTDFGLRLAASVYKQDTSFLNTQFSVGGKRYYNGLNYLEGFVQQKVVTTLSLDTNALMESLTLPDILDNSQTLYGVTWHFQQLDYQFNPRKGLQSTLRLGVGKSRINFNVSRLNLNETNEQLLDNALDSVAENESVLQLEWRVKKYTTLSKNLVWLAAVHTATRVQEVVSRADAFRIGGSKTLRGFAEQSEFVQQYGILSNELRLITSKNGYFALFNDLGYLNNVNGQNAWVYGFGGGMSFETGSGIFNLSYAVGGKRNISPIEFRNARLHFGYVNYF